MTRIDLDDLPPKIAKLLTAVPPGEEVLLLKDGLVIGRLVSAAAPLAAEPPAENQTPEQRAAEIFENFRAAIEEDF